MLVPGGVDGDSHYEHRSGPGPALRTNSSFMFHVKHVALCAPTRIRQEWLVRHRSAPAFRTRPSSRNGISSCPVTAPGYRCPPIPGQAPRHRYRRRHEIATNHGHDVSLQRGGFRAFPPSQRTTSPTQRTSSVRNRARPVPKRSFFPIARGAAAAHRRVGLPIWARLPRCASNSLLDPWGRACHHKCATRRWGDTTPNASARKPKAPCP